MMSVPGLANWLLEIDTPFMLVGHSHRAYALPSIEIRPRIRELFLKAFRVCFDAAAHIGAAKRQKRRTTGPVKYALLDFTGERLPGAARLTTGRPGEPRNAQHPRASA